MQSFDTFVTTNLFTRSRNQLMLPCSSFGHFYYSVHTIFFLFYDVLLRQSFGMIFVGFLYSSDCSQHSWWLRVWAYREQLWCFSFSEGWAHSLDCGWICMKHSFYCSKTIQKWSFTLLLQWKYQFNIRFKYPIVYLIVLNLLP